MQFAGGSGIGRAEVHDDPAVAGVLEQATGVPDHRLDHRAVRQREHDHVAAFGQLGQAVGFGGAVGGDPGRVGVDGEHGVPGLDHPARHPAAHVAGAHHPDRPAPGRRVVLHRRVVLRHLLVLPRRVVLRCHPPAPSR